MTVVKKTFSFYQTGNLFHRKKTAANSLALSFLKLYLLMPSKNVKSQNL